MRTYSVQFLLSGLVANGGAAWPGGGPDAPTLNYSEVETDPQIVHMQTFHSSDHPVLGSVRGVQAPVWCDRMRDVPELPLPRLGQDTEEQARLAGFTDEQIAELRAAKALEASRSITDRGCSLRWKEIGLSTIFDALTLADVGKINRLVEMLHRSKIQFVRPEASGLEISISKVSPMEELRAATKKASCRIA